MNRINRVTSILIQLQSKKIIPAKEIAQRFNISLRTVYRDIRTLEEAGIPIGSEAGKGYFLVEGFLLPPVMFTAAEVGALITAGKFLNCHGDESFIGVPSAYEEFVSIRNRFKNFAVILYI
ncbi:helix-turn-helix transcriptional regulator [Streptococcus hyovaginalis]|uniref:helix-turn-helix transcriptional regulator n=1 Tax=Streptococcus hyovaginalis TaxID=149015 RepID=UPI003D30268B